MTVPAALPRAPGALAALPLMLIASGGWACAFLWLKIAGADLTPAALAALRGLLGGGLIGLWLLAVRRQSILPRGREWRDWLLLGLLHGALPNVLTIYALTQITAGLTSMIQASTPLLVAVLAHALFADERLSGRRLLGVVTGFCGMLLLIGPKALSGDGGTVAGAAAMALTALSYAVGNVYIRSIPAARPTRLAFGQQAVSGLSMGLAALALFGTAAFAGADRHLATLLLLGLFGTALPIVLFITVLRSAGPTVGSMIGYLVPVWTVALGVMLLAEPLVPRELLAGLVILAGIAITSSARRRPAATG